MADFTSSLNYSYPVFDQKTSYRYNGKDGLFYGGTFNPAFQYGILSSSVTVVVASGSASINTLYRSYVTGTLTYTLNSIPIGATFITIVSIS